MIYLIFLFALAAPQVLLPDNPTPQGVVSGPVGAAPLLTVIEDDRFPADQPKAWIGISCGQDCASLR